MVWPDNIEIQDLIWRQQSNPLIDIKALNFESLQNPFQKSVWRGLHMSESIYETRSAINGDSEGGWDLPIGVYLSQRATDPKLCLRGPDATLYPWVTKVQLWAKDFGNPVIDPGGSIIGARQEHELEKESPNESEEGLSEMGTIVLVDSPQEPVLETNESYFWPVITYERINGEHGIIVIVCTTEDGTAVQGEDFVFMKSELKWMDGVKYSNLKTVCFYLVLFTSNILHVHVHSKQEQIQ